MTTPSKASARMTPTDAPEPTPLERAAADFSWPETTRSDWLEWEEDLYGANGPHAIRLRLARLTELVLEGVTICPTQGEHYLGSPGDRPCEVCRDYATLAGLLHPWVHESAIRNGLLDGAA